METSVEDSLNYYCLIFKEFMGEGVNGGLELSIAAQWFEIIELSDTKQCFVYISKNFETRQMSH